MLRPLLRRQIRRLGNFVHRTCMLARIIPLIDSLKAMLWRNDFSRIIKTELRNLRIPFAFRPGISDVIVLRKVFLESEYELPFPISIQTIVDAGAHIVAATVFYQYRFPDARILA